MKKDILFSVIMPVYNVEKYLKKAVDSVLNQTYKNFEIILVDDASPDNCPAICDNYASNYYNIKTIHHLENKGLSEARNTGLKYISGEYVTFMDSDDFIEQDLFSCVYNSLMNNYADVVVFGCKEDYYNKKAELYKSYDLRPKEFYCERKEEICKKVVELEAAGLYGYAWNKFFSTEIIKINGLTFRNVVLIEDIDFNIKFFNYADKLNILGITSYHYAKRGEVSLTSKFVPEYYEVHQERISMLCDQQKMWNNFGEYEKKVFARLFARYIFSALSRNCDKRAGMSHSLRKQWIKEVYKQNLFYELIPFASSENIFMKFLIFVL